jgi:hypothetical protein
VLAGALVAAALFPAAALAFPPRIVNLWVAAAPTAISASDSSCAAPGYNAIQSAVNAAPAGAVIHVCAGTYAEQVQITQSVSIVGSGPVTVQLPSTPANSTTACDTASDTATPGAGDNQDGIVICGTGVTASITGLTVDAAWNTNTCNDNLYGVLVGGGATLDFANDAITAAGAVPLNGCQGGIGIEVGMSWTAPESVGHAFVQNVKVSGYQKNGITIDGTGSTAVIDDAAVTGIGATTATAQNGIQVGDGAWSQITGSTVSGNECDNATCGSNLLLDYQAAGVLLYGAAAGTSVSGSQIDGNDIGVDAIDTAAAAPSFPQAAIDDDVLAGDRYDSIVFDQGWATASGDVLSGGQVGLQVLQYGAFTSGVYAGSPGQSYPAKATASFDTIRGMTVAAAQITSDRQAGDQPAFLSIEFSLLDGNAARILNNSENSTVIQLFDF